MSELTSKYDEMSREELRAEVERLIGGEEPYRITFERAAVGIAHVAPDGRWLRFNDALTGILGYSRSALQSMTFADITHPEDLDEDWSLASQVIAGTLDRYSIEKRYLRPDGGVVWANLSVSLARTPDGTPLHFVSVVEDITEKKSIERALRESEAQYRQITEGLPQMVWSAGATGERDYYNARWREYTGEGLEENPNPWLAALHPEDRDEAQTTWARAVLEGAAYEGEYRLRRADGQYRWFLGRATAIRDEAGHVVRWFGTCTDIHDQKVTEGILALTNRLGVTLTEQLDVERIVQALTDASTEAVDAEFGSFFYARPEEERDEDGGERFGLYVLSGAPREAFSSFPPVRTTRLFTPTFKGEGTVRVDDVQQDPRFTGMPTGHLPVRSYLAVTVRSRDEGILGGLLFGHSEPGRFTAEHQRLVEAFAAQASVAYENAILYRRLEEAKEDLENRVADRTEELVRANRDLNEFSYSVAHDLRAPLRSIVATSKILLADAGERLNEEERATLERQATNAVRLAAIVDDLLAFAKLANSELHKSEFDLTALAKTTVAEVSKRWPQPCEVAIQEGLLARGDSRLIGYVLTNLIDNAFKFSPNGGLIEIGEESGRFFVRDHGIGFDMTHAHKIFVAFERLVRQEAFEGTGVGLANVKRIVERHGGQVWAESQPEKGSTFWFTLG